MTLNPFQFDPQRFRSDFMGILADTDLDIGEQHLSVGRRIVPARTDFYQVHDRPTNTPHETLTFKIPHESGATTDASIWRVRGHPAPLSANPVMHMQTFMGPAPAGSARQGLSVHTGFEAMPYEGPEHFWDTLQKHHRDLEDALTQGPLASRWDATRHRPKDAPLSGVYGRWDSFTSGAQHMIDGVFDPRKNFEFKKLHEI